MTASDTVLAELLVEDAAAIAKRATERYLARRPGLEERFGPDTSARCTEDGLFHLRHLAAAVATGHPALFAQYAGWLRSLMHGLGMDGEETDAHLRLIAETCVARLGETAAEVVELVESALAVAADEPGEPSYLASEGATGSLARDYLTLLLGGDRHGAICRVVDAVATGTSIEAVYLEVFQPCLREIGRLWQLGRISVAQEHMVTAATQLAMAQLYPQLFATPRTGRSVVVANPDGELHEVGGRMLADIFELRGWTSRYVGANTPVGDLAELVRETRPDVVALSATLGAQVPAVTAAVTAVRGASGARVLVGGRPFLQVPELWEATGADGTAPDAVDAVALADQLLTVA